MLIIVGYEVIYGFIHHILGEEGKYNGVAMNVGHYSSHFCSTSRCKVSKVVFRKLIHTGVALWMQSFSPKTKVPCCDLAFVGGDGTFIGIPIQNVPVDVKPVWQPEVLLPSETGSRNLREALADCLNNLTSEARQQLRDDLKRAICDSMSDLDRYQLSYVLSQKWRTLQVTMSEFSDELWRWMRLPSVSRQFEPLRTILSCLISKDSVTGAFPFELSETLLKQKTKMIRVKDCESFVEEMCDLYAFNGCGVGPEIIRILRVQGQCQDGFEPSTISMILYFGAYFSQYLHFEVPLTRLFFM